MGDGPANKFEGIAAWEGRDTEDGRRIEPYALDFRTDAGQDAMPVYNTLLDQAPNFLGDITGKIRKPDGGIVLIGRTSLEPGEYQCGIDIRIDESHYDDGVLVVDKCRLLGLCVYLGGNKPAWPDAKITVTTPVQKRL